MYPNFLSSFTGLIFRARAADICIWLRCFYSLELPNSAGLRPRRCARRRAALPVPFRCYRRSLAGRAARFSAQSGATMAERPLAQASGAAGAAGGRRPPFYSLRASCVSVTTAGSRTGAGSAPACPTLPCANAGMDHQGWPTARDAYHPVPPKRHPALR